jgi:hypothetical protein
MRDDTWTPRHITAAKIAVRLRDLVGVDGVVTVDMVAAALEAEGIHSDGSVRSYVLELMARGYVVRGVLSRDAALDQAITIKIRPRGAAKEVERAVGDALVGYDGIAKIRMGDQI